MASMKLVVAVLGVACLLLPGQVDSKCDLTAFSNCHVPSLTGSDMAAVCKALGEYVTCAKNAGVDECTTGVGIYAGFKDTYDKCGAAQFLMSWPLYLTVLVLTLKQTYASM